MNPRTKLFIADSDCASLVSLMLWLEQFPEFDVEGAAISGFDWVEQLSELKPDVILLNADAAMTETLPGLRALKSGASAPALLVRLVSDNVDSLLANEADETIGPETSIKELCESIRKVANKRRVAVSAANMPRTKAG